MTRSGKAIIASAALVLMVGACGSSSSKSLTPGGNSKSGGSNSNSGGSGGGGSLSDLLGKGKTADVKVTYKTGDTSSSSFTYIQRGSDSVIKSNDFATYTIGGKTTTCTGSGSSVTCTSIPNAGSAGAGLGAGLFGTYNKVLENLAASPLVKDMKTSGATIAGRSAKCVTLTGALAAAGQSGTVCVDAQTGLLLRVEAEGKTQFEATSVGSPSDSDFKLPAKPTTLTIPTYTSTP